MSDVRAELDGLEDDLDAFIRERVAPSLGNLETRIAQKIERVAEQISGELTRQNQEFLAELTRQNQARIRQLENQIDVLSRQLETQDRHCLQLEQGLGKLDGRMAALAKRFGREEVPGRHLAVHQAAPSVSEPAYEQDESDVADIGRYIRENWIGVALIGAAAVVVIFVAWIVIARLNEASGTHAIPDRGELAGAFDQATPPNSVYDTQAHSVAADQTADIGRINIDTGLQAIADKSGAVAKLCPAPGACHFEDVWSRAKPAARQLLLVEAIKAADFKACKETRPAKVDAQNLEGPYRLVVSCISAGPPAKLKGPDDYQAAAKQLLGYLGSHP